MAIGSANAARDRRAPASRRLSGRSSRRSSYPLDVVGSRRRRLAVAASVVCLGAGLYAVARAGGSEATVPPTGIHKIQHVIVIMQENRSFDHYFGTYPGADGIPAGVCAPDPKDGGCL